MAAERASSSTGSRSSIRRCDPLPTPAVTALQPNGLYLLRGPFNTDGPCLVLDLDETSYPTDPSAAGAASVRWWERAVADPGNPASA